MNTGVWAGGACWLTRSMPGRNHQAAGTGGDERTGTTFPSGSNARASARAEPSVSPSASLCVTAVITGALSITCQIRGASSATSGRGGASSATGVGLPLLDLAQKLADPDAVGHALIELEMQVRCEAQVREPGAKLAPDEAFRVLEAVDRGLPAVGVGDDADLDGGIPQIGGQLDLGDRGHPDARVFQVANHDFADLLAQLCGDAFDSVTAHTSILLVHLDVDQIGEQRERRLLDMRLVKGDRQPAGDIRVQLDSHRKAIDREEGIVRAHLDRCPAGAE